MPDLTPAEEIREAARLMRERAQIAEPSPWLPFRYQATERVITPDRGGVAICDVRPDAEYIASWHPAVALAVADWLDSFAGRLDDREYDYRDWNAALAVARAYLGTKEQADA